MADWVTRRLGDIATVFDGPHSTPTKTDAGPWYLSISSLASGHVDLGLSAHIGEDQYAAWTRRTAPQRGDTLFSYETRIGQAALWNSDERAALGRRMGLLRPKRDEVDPRFLSLAYLSAEFQELIRTKTVHGATVERILIADMPNWPISIPPLDEQRRIAGALGALDELIEVDRLEAERLVLLAQAVLSGGDAGSVLVSDVATLSRGLSYKGSGLVSRDAAGCVPMVNLANFTVRGWLNEDGLKYYSESFKGQHILRSTDLLIANTDLTQRREILGRAALVQPSLVGAIHSHHTSVVRFPREASLHLFLWAQSQGPEFRERAMGFATGTTVAALPKEAVLDFSIRLPSNPDQVAATADTLVRQAWSREEEVAELVRVRDELLPLLMSGKVRVSEDLAAA